jgi:creatinine amidohydrolase
MERGQFFTEGGDHADEMETSLMLYLKPELVLPPETWGEGKSKKFRIKAFSEGWVWAERQWSKVSEDTGIGNPKLASRDKGERFFKAVSLKMGALFLDLCKADIQDLYE